VLEAMTFQYWFTDLINRRRAPTKIQVKHEALKVESWAAPEQAEMLSEWLDRKILRAMKKLRPDGLPTAGWGASKGADGSRYIKRPETWTFDDWQFNVLLKMQGAKRDVRRASVVYDFGLSSWPEQAQQWPRPDENPHFYWNLPELEALEP